MEGVISESVNDANYLPSTIDEDSSVDEEILFKRNCIKNVFDSGDESEENYPTRTYVQRESDSESLTGKEIAMNQTTLKRVVRELDNESEDLGGKDGENCKTDSGITSQNEAKDVGLGGSLSEAVDLRPSQFSQSDLYAAESSEDEGGDDPTPVHRIESPVHLKEDSPVQLREDSPPEQPRGKKSKIHKPKATKTDIKKIHSESQRMVRESRVSLPYHRPRQRTLAEFLNRRKTTTVHATTLKTSPTKLDKVWKCLEEKAKEAEEFYKSDSEDSGPDNDEDSKEYGRVEVSEKEDNQEYEPETPKESSSSHLDVLVDQVTNSENLDGNSPGGIKGLKDGIADGDVLIENLEFLVGDVLIGQVELSSPIIPNGNDVCRESLFQNVESKIDTQCSKGDKSPKVSEVQAASSETNLIEMEKNFEAETDDQLNTVDHSNSEDEISEILNTILEEVVANNQTKSANGVLCAGSFEKHTRLTELKTDFSNLFTSKALEKSDKELSSVRGDSEGTCTLGDKPLFDCGGKTMEEEKLDIHSVKVPSPLHLDDSESMSLRLDDDTMDEMKSIHTLCNDSANPKSSADDDARDGGDSHKMKVSTPVKMLRELEYQIKDAPNEDIPKSLVSGHPSIVKEDLLPIILSPVGYPLLEGNPDNVIDLDEDVRKPRKTVGVRDLVQRFIKHHIPKKATNEKKNGDFGIVVVDGDGENNMETVKREVVSVTVGGFDPMKHKSCGVGFRSFREELQREIARKRDEEWVRRQKEYSINEERGMEEGDDKCDLDDEEEEELMDSSSSEEEDCIEDDVDMTAKSRPKSQYLDDEAEESDGEESDEGNSVRDGEEEEEALILKNDVEAKEKQIDEEPGGVRGCENDDANANSPILTEMKNFQCSKTFDLFDSEDDDDVNESIVASAMSSPPATPFAQCRNNEHARLSLPSPALPLTALQGYMNSPSSGTRSPWASAQKLLYSEEDSPKQAKDELNSLNGKSALRNLIGSSQGSQLPENELLNLMSGSFLSRANKIDEADDDFSLALEETQELFDKSQLKHEDKDESFGLLRSRVEDSKGSPKASWNSLSLSFGDKIDEGDKEVDMDDGLRMGMKRKKLMRLNISDDEDDGEMQEVDKVHPLADGEEGDIQEEGENEELVEGSGGEEECDEEGVTRVMEYDSEENAVVVEERARKKVSRVRRGLEFLEVEAELSDGEGSGDWHGSGDEDERGLDQMEKEEGDADKLDDEIVRRELGRIHMRQVLDEDKRDVRLLQEYFLEDGELHSDAQGRERKFRWRNIDNIDDGDYQPLGSSDDEKGAGEDEDADEERWRRLRHERETWLREHQKKETIEDSESLLNEMGEDSQLLKLGRAALRRINSFPSNALTKWLKPNSDPKEENEEVEKPAENESPEVKRPFQMLCKRGSFLARKDGALEKLAEMAIKSAGGVEQECLTSTSPIVAKTKNSRKFVFTMLSPEKKDPKDRLGPPKDSSMPTEKGVKRKKKNRKVNSILAKKSKFSAEASIFQFL